MIPANIRQAMEKRLEQLHSLGAGTIGDMLQLRLLEYRPEKQEFLLTCQTQTWMRNSAGTLHGGMCATLVDQAMGCAAYCAKPGEGTAPTVDLNVNYLRPLIPGEEVLLRVRIVSAGRSLLHLSAEASLASAPEHICLTSTGTYFYKPSSPQPAGDAETGKK